MVALQELLLAERVVHEACECDAVAKELERADLRVPDEDGHDDEKDVLENAGEGHDEARGLADL